MEFVEQHVEMELLLVLSNVMIEIMLPMMAVLQHAQFNNCGLVLVNHLSVHTMVHQFVETEELREDNNVMMEMF